MMHTKLERVVCEVYERFARSAASGASRMCDHPDLGLKM